MKRAVLLVMAVALVAALSWWIHAASDPVAHRDARLTPEAWAIYANGRIEGAAPEVELHAWSAGRVTEVFVCEGEQVAAGQRLLKLDDRQHQLAVALAEAELAHAEGALDRLVNGARVQERLEAESAYQAKQALLERAQLTWRRTQQLHAEGVLTQEQADNDRTTVAHLRSEVAAAKARADMLAAPARSDERRIAEAQVRAATAKLQQARLELQRRELRAPFAGQVLLVNVEAGEMTDPAAGSAAILMADTSRLRVRAFVEELEAPQVKTGMAAIVRLEGVETPYHGRVTRVSPRMNKKNVWADAPTERYDTKTRDVLIELDDVPDLIIGLGVDVEILRAEE